MTTYLMLVPEQILFKGFDCCTTLTYNYLLNSQDIMDFIVYNLPTLGSTAETNGDEYEFVTFIKKNLHHLDLR